MSLSTRIVARARRPATAFYLETLFNAVGTHVPSHRVRQGWLRLLGAEIGSGTTIFRGTTILSAATLRVGAQCAIGWRCVLDARGGLQIEDRVVIASDSQIMTGDHDLRDPGFRPVLAPVKVERYAWIATRAMILKGVTIGQGAVVSAGAVATRDVEQHIIVAGVPAKPIGTRVGSLKYDVDFQPRFW